jgi:hypothetical protein
MPNRLDEDLFIQEVEEFFYKRHWEDYADMLDELRDMVDKEYDNLIIGETQ